MSSSSASRRRAALLCLTTVVSVSGLSTPSVLDRVGYRNKLLSLLGPSDGVVPINGELTELVQELERVGGMVPATPAFLALGLQGRWTLRAIGAPDVHEMPHVSFISVGATEQEFDLDASTPSGGMCGQLRSSCEFAVDETAEPLAGRLQTEADVYLTTHADTLHLMLARQAVVLPRLPREPVESVLGALHAQLSAEFRTDEGMRVSLQTMYLDEALHISRCTTRGLAGLCAIFVRPQD